MNQNFPAWLPLRAELSELSPYGAPQVDVPVRLNTNENPYNLSDELQEALLAEISRCLKDLNRYPDRDALALRQALANSINTSMGVEVDSSSIWAANGSNEIIQTILLAFEGGALGFEPSYSMHPLISKVVGKKWISIPRDDNYEIGAPQIEKAISATEAKIVFITTPNNPTGTTTSLESISKIATALASRKGLVVVDEAYGEFSKNPSAITLIKTHPNLLVSKTMSKAFAFAGARLGYLIADPKVIEALQLVRLPYHLSALTQAAALAAISKQSSLIKDVERLQEAREEVAREIHSMGLKSYPSEANFLLFSGFADSAAKLWEELLNRGVLVRDVGIPGHLRVTIGTRAENRAFLDALKQTAKIRVDHPEVRG
ncbi:MAG: histidinol-phosphate transaminase [Candidatus Nanopelagicaceae bacterium]|nr:histidinol-phosphate transaminase [Candidatus Nanopelagicaceae bacterium]